MSSASRRIRARSSSSRGFSATTSLDLGAALGAPLELPPRNKKNPPTTRSTTRAKPPAISGKALLDATGATESAEDAATGATRLRPEEAAIDLPDVARPFTAAVRAEVSLRNTWAPAFISTEVSVARGAAACDCVGTRMAAPHCLHFTL